MADKTKIESSTGLTLLRQEHGAPPLLGEDTTEILRWADVAIAPSDSASTGIFC